MKWVRRHRQRFILIFSFGAIAAMTFGYLKRIGVDPLSGFGQEATTSPVSSGSDCDPQPYDGPCELLGATAIQLDGRRAVRARYRLLDAPGRVRVERVTHQSVAEIESEPQLSCRGEWMAGPCPTGPFVFSPLATDEAYDSPQ